MRQSGEHTHATYSEKVFVEKIRSGMKRAANEANATTNNVIAQNVAGA